MYSESRTYRSQRFPQVRQSSQTCPLHTSDPCTLHGSTVNFLSVHTTDVMIQHLCTELLTPFTPAAPAPGRGEGERPRPRERGPAELPATKCREQEGKDGRREPRRQAGRQGGRQEAASGAALRAAPGAKAGGGALGGQRHGLLRSRSQPGQGPGGKSGGALRFLAPWPDFSPARSPSPQSRSPSRPPGHVKSRVMRLNPAPSRGAAGRARSQLGPCPGEPPRRPERPQLF